MTADAGFISGNLMLDAMPSTARAGIEHDLTVVELKAHRTTNSAGAPIRFVDFPVDAVLSIVATLETGISFEVGTVGRESFVESDVGLQSSTALRGSFCQVAGSVLRMDVGRFVERMAGGTGFARSIRRNVRATLFTAQQFAACNLGHTPLQRCARWLAMTSDRVGRPDFTLGIEFLGIMLGVETPIILESTAGLERLGAVRYRRNAVTIVDRALLESIACECYGWCNASYVASRSAEA